VNILNNNFYNDGIRLTYFLEIYTTIGSFGSRLSYNRSKRKVGRKQRGEKTEFAEGKFISDRSAGVLSEPNPLKAVRRVLRDKEREGVAKGRESATETFAPLIFCMRPYETRIKGVERPLDL